MISLYVSRYFPKNMTSEDNSVSHAVKYFIKKKYREL